MWRFFMLASALSTSASAQGYARIVSLNPCVDAILLRVADPARVAAVSHYSYDPAASSVPLSLAKRFPATGGTAEEVIALRPDLVIAGPHVALPTLLALGRLGVRVVKFPVPTTIAESRAQVTMIAQLAGAPARGRALNAQIEAALTQTRWSGAPASALIRLGSGLVPGRDTLADELMRWTGFTNASAALGLKQWDVLPLELLLAKPPRIVFASQPLRMQAHPALRRLAQRVTVVAFEPRLLNCAGPTIIQAAERLSAARVALR